MSGRLTTWFPVVLMTMLAMLTFWLDQTVQDPQSQRGQNTRHAQDYWIENFSAQQLGEDGLPLNMLTAAKMMHFPDNDTSELINPRFVSLDKSRPAVEIKARQGLLTGRGEKIVFSDNVEVRREAQKDSSWLTLSTDFLQVEPDNQFAKTHRPVTIRTPSTVITATGMEMNNKSQVLKLLSSVKGQYAQP
ncbi:MAG: LPS export ABC transporter periplasmic protein LptC [Sulfuricellaceae bacterium]|nr:LPS export ABC transporter periplasmic protein LptC [Sulfuricellaceae bacterium]